MFLLGYLSKENRVFLIDKEKRVVSFKLSSHLLDYMSMAFKGDIAGAQKLFKHVPHESHNHIARFLHSLGERELALDITSDADHRFELALEVFSPCLCFGIDSMNG